VRELVHVVYIGSISFVNRSISINAPLHNRRPIVDVQVLAARYYLLE
jgi:hypothetical protein